MIKRILLTFLVISATLLLFACSKPSYDEDYVYEFDFENEDYHGMTIILDDPIYFMEVEEEY